MSIQRDRASEASKAREAHFEQLTESYKKYKNPNTGFVEFLKKDPASSNDLLNIFKKNVTLTTSLTTVVCGVAGGICGSPAGAPGIKAGVELGIPIGIMLGTALSTYEGYETLYPRYTAWKKTEPGVKYAKDLQALWKEDEQIAHMLCGIHKVPVINGVRTPDGQLYEKETIEQWVTDHGTNPGTGEKITLQDLIRDKSVNAESAKSYREFLVKTKKEAVSLVPELEEGIEEHIADLEQQLLQTYNRKLVKAQTEWKGKKISYTQFLEKQEKLAQTFLKL